MKEHIDEMAKVLIDYTKKNHIMASHAILEDYAEALYTAGYRKQIENEALEAVDMFRNLIVNRFIELCNYNDYGKINLLLIGETIDRIYDDVIAKMKGGAE